MIVELVHPTETVTGWRALPWYLLAPFVIVHALLTGRGIRFTWHDRTVWSRNWTTTDRTSGEQEGSK